MRITIISIVLVIISSMSILSQDKNENNEIKYLLKKWDKSDGEETFIIGMEISKYLIKNDSLFFKEMKNNSKGFESWLKELQSVTFTAYEAGDDEVEKILWTAYYKKLKELMMKKALKWMNSTKYSKLAEKIAIKLNSIKIRFID